jgi:tetratricopeptide (TPR) repeat protein
MVFAASGCAGSGELTIRPQAGGLAAGERPPSFRVAEARAQFALGNIALAAEGFRRAIREDPASVDALNGIAACYDRMGRFDLSRDYYERALALAPGDGRLYANLATSLELQGRGPEAARLRGEWQARQGAAQVATVQLAPISEVRPAPATPTGSRPAEAVTVALAPAPSTDHWIKPEQPRLERVSLAEVVLVTGSGLRWGDLGTDAPTDRTRAAAAAPAAARRDLAQVVLLNAARSQGLAARTRMHLKTMGWKHVAIGDAPRALGTSRILYPADRRAEALRLSRQLGISLQRRADAGDRLIVHLGRDANGRRTGA